ncbi:MAG: ACT domain-containing protein [Clostridia bacterium]|nr:ACT domain-containing protein [Clostridia bacterium]
MTTKQVSIFIENRQGRLAEVTDIIAKNGINIRALSVADTTSFGILRLIVDDPERLEGILREHHITASITSVLAVCINDKPGGLVELLRLLEDIQIEYMYTYVSSGDGACIILRVDRDAEAVRRLTAAGFRGPAGK